MNTKMIYTRRGFVKMAAGAVAAAALVATGASTLDIDKAFAGTRDNRDLGAAVAQSEMVPGTWYSASVNLYVKAQFNVIVHMDAYLTNLTKPTSLFGSKPTTPVSDNGLVRLNSDGSYSVYVDDLNNTFGLMTIGGSRNGGAAKDDSGSTCVVRGYYDWDAVDDDRIDAISFTLPAGYSGEPSFAATEYANFMNQGDKDWPVTLKVDFDTVKAVSGLNLPEF